jgi:hypothetical protein
VPYTFKPLWAATRHPTKKRHPGGRFETPCATPHPVSSDHQGAVGSIKGGTQLLKHGAVPPVLKVFWNLAEDLAMTPASTWAVPLPVPGHPDGGAEGIPAAYPKSADPRIAFVRARFRSEHNIQEPDSI